MLTTNELKDALAADAAAQPLNADRLAQVHGRVTVRRRRRTVATGLASVAVLAAAALVVIPQLGDNTQTAPPARPSPSATADVPLPQYRQGGVLIAQAERSGSQGFQTEFTPTGRELFFSWDCFVPREDAEQVMVAIRVNGEVTSEIGCDKDPVQSGGNTFEPPPETFDQLSLGTPAMLSVSYESTVPSSSHARIGVYQRVPIANYPFPAAPRPLPVLEPVGNFSAAGNPSTLALLSAGPLSLDVGSPEIVGARGTWSKTITLKRGLRLDGQTVAPGTVTILVNGTSVGSFSGWDYTNAFWQSALTLKELGISPGDPVTVTVTAERFPGDSWVLLLTDDVF